MNNEKQVLEENRGMLHARRRFFADGPPSANLSRWGLTPDMHQEIASLDECQVERAADCAAPLFGLIHLDDVLINVLQSTQALPIASLASDSLDKLIEDENLSMLLARWASSRESPQYAQMGLGMSQRLVAVMHNATINDMRRASKRVVRLATIRVTPQYFFHAGRNISMQRSQRTHLAICSTATRTL